MKKRAINTLSAIGRMLLWLPLMLIGAYVIHIALDALYAELYGYMPELFPLFDPVNEKESFAAHNGRMGVFSTCVTLALYAYLTVRGDNGRDEWTIAKTDGLFRVRDEILPYLSEYAAADAIASAFMGAAIGVPFIFIPDAFLHGSSTLASFIRPLSLFYSVLGPVMTPIVLCLLLLSFRLLSALPALAFYRAKWLSGFSLYFGGEDV